jgi:DNA-binding CsgD family transcriptional regulator
MQQAYVRGLEGAYAAGDDAGLASLATLGAVVLDSVGDHAGAIARLDQALTLASEDGEARPRILATRAIYEAVGEQLSEARTSLVAAADAIPAAASMETRLDVEMCTAMVSCVALDLGELPQASSTIADAQAERLDSIASALMVYLTETLGAIGESSEARAWADALQGYAGAVQHPARSIDALVAQFALKTRRTLELDETEADPQDLDGQAGRTFNNAALWRTRVLVTYSALMRGDRVAARDAVASLDSRRSVMHPAFQSASDGFALAVRAMLEPGVTIESAMPPEQATLLSISGALASAEATAIAGSQSRAADWLTWFDRSLPARVVTSMEWPVCRKRVEGLLLLRLGDSREAVVRLQEAVRCCDERGDAVQAGIGRIQLAEALVRGSGVLHPSYRALLIGQADPDALRNLGVDPIPFAYAASRTFLREEKQPERGGLTPREVQVLGRLAQGMTYDAIGKELKINPRTVGVHASHCYEKLGVRNRVEAVQTATRLGIV